MKRRQPFNIFQIIQSLKENYITCYLTRLLKSNFKIYKRKLQVFVKNFIYRFHEFLVTIFKIKYFDNLFYMYSYFY